MPQPSPKPQPHLSETIRGTAEALMQEYGDAALVGAKSALRAVERSGDLDAISYWAKVCTIIASDVRICL